MLQVSCYCGAMLLILRAGHCWAPLASLLPQSAVQVHLAAPLALALPAVGIAAGIKLKLGACALSSMQPIRRQLLIWQQSGRKQQSRLQQQKHALASKQRLQWALPLNQGQAMHCALRTEPT
jgi:hypothetical protein